MRVTVPLLLALSLLVMPAAAQDHEHDMSEGMLMIMADLPEDGRTVVGELSHFQYVLLSPAGIPFVHHDFHIDVTLNGITLYSTEHAHDYDGVGDLDVVFPTPGAYNVTVTVPLESEEGAEEKALIASYTGYVVPADGAVPATLRFDGPTTTGVGALTTFTYAVVDANDTLLPHTDALVQVRRLADDFLVLEAHTHSHTADMAFSYAFEKAGQHEIRIIGYTAFPDPTATVFAPVVHRHMIDVTDDGPIVSVAPMTQERAAILGSHHAHSGDGYTTHVTADPVQGTRDRVEMMPTTGPFSQVRASYVVHDANMTLVAHTDHTATLTGPDGAIFTSDSLHEYDGVLTLMSANQAFGDYTWEFTARQGDWTDEKSYSYQVSPVPNGRSAGPIFSDVTGLDQLAVATPKPVGFFARNAAGLPFTHSEIAFEVQDDDGIPLLRQKLHTHADGRFAFQAAMGDAEAHTLHYELFDIHSSYTPRYHGKDLESGRTLAFTPLTGAEWPIIAQNMTQELPVEKVVPGPMFLLGLVAVLAFVGLRRRA